MLLNNHKHPTLTLYLHNIYNITVVEQQTLVRVVSYLIIKSSPSPVQIDTDLLVGPWLGFQSTGHPNQQKKGLKEINSSCPGLCG